jgi:very-short-patch-repair endonuclease
MNLSETLFFHNLKENGIELPEKEFKFYPGRRWRFDYAWPNKKIALEIEGGVWIMGRHNRGTGFIKDLEKYNTATMEGWSVLRIQPQDLPIKSADMIARTLLNRGK